MQMEIKNVTTNTDIIQNRLQNRKLSQVQERILHNDQTNIWKKTTNICIYMDSPLCVYMLRPLLMSFCLFAPCD